MTHTASLLEVVETGILRLATLSPDGCALHNGVGFSAQHVGIGQSLANNVGSWTPKQARTALAICQHYAKTQLADLDIPADGAELIEREAREAAARLEAELLEEAGTDFGLRWSEPREVNTKQGPRIVRSASPTDAFWAAWRKEKESLKARGISVSQYNGAWQVSEWTAPNGVTKPAFEAKPWTVEPLKNPTGLLPYQIPAVENLVAALRANNSALDASDTGTGKTYIALAAVRELGKSAVVVCPKSVIPSWERAAAHIGVEIRVINYEKVRRGNTPYGSWLSKEQFRWSGVDSEEVLIFDEVHRCKGHKTQNGLLLQAARRGGFTTIALSATAATNPLEMKGLGYVLGLHQLKGFWDWARKYGARPSRWGGFEFVGGKEDLAKLHAAIFPRKGNRVRVEDLGDAFPETQVHTQLVNLGEDTARKVDEIFEEMKDSLAELKKRSAEDAPGNHLTVRLRARQQTELLKVPAFVELAEDFVEQGHSVAIFVSFNETLSEIGQRLEDLGVVYIHGSQTDAERQSAIDAFQSDAARVIVCNIRAGGVGVSLHDLHGKHARVALISPTDSAVDLRQTLGRVHRAGGKTKSIQRIIGVAGSVEEKVLRNVEEKLENLDALNDGDLTVA